ncbi:MAG TPA: hypothetical protein VGH72_33495 [Pseudonocardia sp.]|jgi:hypothetical protein
MTDSDETALVLGGQTLPTARNIRTVLREQIEAGVITERRRRGDVHQPEDTFPMQRSLADVIRACLEYRDAFDFARKEALAIAEEELITAVGDQDGIPASPLTVPDAEGDVKITLDTQNEYDIDPDALRSAVAFAVLSDSAELIERLFREDIRQTPDQDWDEREGILAQLITDALTMLGTLGKFTPQVSKVRAFAAELARTPGGDGVSSTVSSSIRKNVRYRGVKVERKEGK